MNLSTKLTDAGNRLGVAQGGGVGKAGGSQGSPCRLAPVGWTNRVLPRSPGALFSTGRARGIEPGPPNLTSEINAVL